MKFSYKIAGAIFLSMVIGKASAQTVNLPGYASDGVRFSQYNYGSSARFKGMGNAQIGTGGDISSISGNPAGLGMFTRSEFTFTPEVNATSMNTRYIDTQTGADKTSLNLNQIGAVFFMPSYRNAGQDTKKGIVSASVGLGYSRQNDYGFQANYTAVNGQSTIYNMLDDNDLNYGLNRQTGNILRSGSVSEFNIAGALNISNQVYIGATLSLTSLRYNNEQGYVEQGQFSAGDDYVVNYNQSQNTRGSGASAKIGVLFKATPQLRLGATLQTPTWFNIDESYGYNVVAQSISAPSNFDQGYTYSYNLRTPTKGSLGGSYVIGSRALISADVDFVDYSSIRFSSPDGGGLDDINTANGDISGDTKSAINYRFGAEVKVTDLVSLRGGYGFNGTPYKDDSDNLFGSKFYSGGIGYRNKMYSVDLAYQRVETHTSFSPYIFNDGTSPEPLATNNKNNFLLTVGLRF